VHITHTNNNNNNNKFFAFVGFSTTHLHLPILRGGGCVATHTS
jgi:hypothetical protein